jgi:hypothetical protein
MLKWLNKSILDLINYAKKGPLAEAGKIKHAKVLIGSWKASLINSLRIVLSVIISSLVELGGLKYLFLHAFILLKNPVCGIAFWRFGSLPTLNYCFNERPNICL